MDAPVSNFTPLHVGLIGCGFIGKIHADCLRHNPGSRLVHVCDSDEASAISLAKEHGVERVSTDAAAVLADRGVEAVVLALPTVYRHSLILKALAAGKHVLNEKPAAMNANQVAEYLAMVDRSQIVAGASARMSLSQSVQAAREFIRAGNLGEIRLIRCRAVGSLGAFPQQSPPGWRLSRRLNGGGILANWGSYDFDCLFSLLDWKLIPKLATAHTWGPDATLAGYVAPDSDGDVHVVALVTCECGAVIHYERAEKSVAKPEHTWEILGSQGRLEFNLVEPQAPVRFYQIVPGTGIHARTVFHAPNSNENIHQMLIDDFVEAALTGRPPQTTLERSFRLTALTDAIYLSASQDGLSTDVSTLALTTLRG